MSDEKKPDDTTVGELLEMAKSYDAGIMKVIPRDHDGKVLGAVIVCDETSADDILSAVEEVEENWDEDDTDEESFPGGGEPPEENMPIPLRIMGISKNTMLPFELGKISIAGMDGSVVFGASDALEITLTSDQMKQLGDMFAKHLNA